MSGEIEATVRGYLGADALVKTVHGNDVCELRVAAGIRHKDASGEWQDVRTDWVDVSAWGYLAADVAHLKKGDKVECRGAFVPGAYINGKGEAVPSSNLMARAVLLVPRVPRSASADGWNTAAGDWAENGTAAQSRPTAVPSAA